MHWSYCSIALSHKCSEMFGLNTYMSHYLKLPFSSQTIISICMIICFIAGMHGDNMILGDSGYPLKTYLMTPIMNIQTPAQERFNRALCRTRVKVEQTIGVLKKRFNCLHDEMRLQPARACQVIVACAVLHNIAVSHNDLEELGQLPAAEDFPQPPPVGDDDATASAVRQRIVNNYF